MALCRVCRVQERPDHPYCLHCGALRRGARVTDFVAPELRTETDPAVVVALAKPVTTIGREPGNDLVLDHPSVSRRHAEIRRTEQGFALADLGSLNGVEVDGRHVPRNAQRLLPDAAQLHIGDVPLRFEQPRTTRVGSRTEHAATTGTVLAVAGAVEGAAPATEPLTARPRRRSGWALKRVPTDRGPASWVLRNTRTGRYLRCDDRDVFLWRRLDGATSIRDLLFAYSQEYGELDLPRIERTLRAFAEAELVGGLPGTAEPGHGSRWRRIGSAVVRSQVALSGIDDLAGRAYRAFGWWFFTAGGVAGLWLLIVAGLYGFVVASGRHDVLDVRGAGLPGVLAGVVAFLVALVVHEAAHAFAVKSYGRQVRRAGFMLVFGLPFAFVDTSDMWFGSRWSRIVVALSGPLTTLALAGGVSLGAAYLPGAAGPAVAYQVAVGLYLNTLFNLNPFAPLDGYQAVADALRRPHLREEALRYLFGGLRADLRAGRRPDPVSLGMAAYAALAIAVMAALLAYSVVLWCRRLAPLVAPYLPPPWDLGPPAAVCLLVVAVVVVRVRRRRRARETEEVTS